MILPFIKFLLNPFNILWLLLVFTGVVWLLEKKRLFRWLAILSGLWFLIISTPLIPVAIINSLENQNTPLSVEQIEDPTADYHILVLGGGHSIDDRLPPNSLLSHNALGRLNEGIRLHRQLPNSILVLSGSTFTGHTTQAELLQRTALSLGVAKESMILHKKPKDTFEEVKVYANEYGKDHPVILVTSAAHMPRALKEFRYFGIEPVPSPAHYRLKERWKQNRFGLGIPSVKNIEYMRAGIYEYAGMLELLIFK